jgi:phosphoglycolate phosphatase-like HAD superfamily hydrolase
MMKLTDYKVLTFDCYGTLIDWEAGILAALQPLLAKAAMPPSKDDVLESFARHESAQEAATPQMIYSDLLAAVHRRLADQWGLAAKPPVAWRRSIQAEASPKALAGA